MKNVPTCNTATCEACNDPTDLNWRRAMGIMENRYIANDSELGDYAYKLETVKALVTAANGDA